MSIDEKKTDVRKINDPLQMLEDEIQKYQLAINTQKEKENNGNELKVT